MSPPDLLQQTLFCPIARIAEARPDSVAIEAAGRSALTFGALQSQVRETVRQLNASGIGREDRIAVVMPPGPELATLSLAVMAGATAAPLNHDYKQPEYRPALERLGARLVVVDDSRSPARAAATELGLPVAVLEPGDAAGRFSLELERTGTAAARGGLAEPSDVALVLETSGTTSKPRTVPLTQANLAASAGNLVRSLELGPDDRCLHVLPLFHIGGLIAVLAAPLSVGASVVCTPGFSVPEFFRCVDAHSPTWAQAVPAMLQELVDHADGYAEIIARRPLRLLRSVSAPLPSPLLEQCERVFGTAVIEIYGMTETSGVITSNPLAKDARRSGSVGVPVGAEIDVQDDTGASVGAGVEGEVVVRGRSVMAGYQDAPEENERSFRAGWFRTGDLGRRDEEGNLFLTGRLKEMINRGGEKIAPREVDELLLAHPAIVDAAVFAVSHASLGEEVAAAVVLAEGESLSGRDVIEYLRPQLAYFKIPRVVHVVPEIPRTAGGKLRRSRLAEDLGVGDSVEEARAPYVAAESPVARLLVELWEGVLEVDAIGIHDDFFLLGGDSLRAATLINEIQQRWGAIVYVSALFDAPTVEQLETFLHERHPELVVRMLGHAVSSDATDDGVRVDAAKMEQLRDSIVSLSTAPAPPPKRNPRAAFILSTPRSGSTLLRAMLGGNSKLFCPPELFLLSFDDLAARRAWCESTQEYLLEGNLRCVMQLRDAGVDEARSLVEGYEAQGLSTREYFALLQSWMGEGELLVDKTPFNAAHPESLQRAETDFEDALFVHLVRHPYGVIRSFEEAKIDQLWYPRLVGAEVAAATPNPFSSREYAEMIWLLLHENVTEFLGGIPAERQMRVRFEDLVSDPRDAMRRLSSFLGTEYEPAMLRPQASKKDRMTDGIYPVSRMIGDMKFHQHEGIDPDVAEGWKQHYTRDFLCDASWAMAERFGYEETVASAQDREEFVI